MNVVRIPNGQFAENSYLVIDPATRECAVIDPGEDAAMIGRRIAAQGARVTAIWITHAHIDHVLGVAALKRDSGAPVFLHPADRPLYDHVLDQAEFFGMRGERLPEPDMAFEPGTPAHLAGLTFDVRATPGHSPGSVSLIGHGAAFTGDVLFQGSIGRTDLPGGDFETLMRSIARQLLTLPDDTIVYSGHGPETTIGHERRHNPFLTGAGRSA